MSLTQAQMRSLLDLALDPEESTVQAVDRRFHAQKALDELGARLGVVMAGTLDRIADERLSISELISVKDLAKRLMADASATQSECEAAQILYHAAVAAALCMQGTQISGEPIQGRREAYLRFSALFSGDSLGDLFARAAAWTLLVSTTGI